MRIGLVLALVAVVLVPAPVVSLPAAVGESIDCPSADGVGLTTGDVLACLPARDAATRAALPPFRTDPTVTYAGAYGPQPKPLPMPAGCDTPVVGTWTQDSGEVHRVRHDADRTTFEAVDAFHWLTGPLVGRSVGDGEFWSDRAGPIVYVGRELFEGTVGGRAGSITLYNLAHLAPAGDYVGQAYAIGGTEQLRGIRMEGTYSGRLGVGGHWEAGSRMCFAGP